MPKATGLDEVLVVNTLGRIDTKLDKLDDRLDEQGKVLVVQQGLLDEHIRRTGLLEEKVELDKAAAKAALPGEVQREISIARSKFLMFSLKVLGVLTTLGGGSWGLREVIAAIVKAWGG